MRGRGPAGRLGGLGDGRGDVRADGPLVGQPEDRAVGALAGELQHLRAERGEQHRRRRDVGDVERVVDAEEVVLDVDRPGPGEGLVEHVEGGRASRPAGRS